MLDIVYITNSYVPIITTTLVKTTLMNDQQCREIT